MNTEDIVRLASLARIRLSDEEVAAFAPQITDVLGYVGVINEITAESEITKKPGARRNIFREDVVTNEPGSYTDALLREAPKTQGKHLKVKKILQTD
jgi:aspartyl-tRNA(Asn)/glutamyl-tRNA(Gln) amidotransferase subunit C